MGNGISVLVVDDEPWMRDLIKEDLVDEGFNVISCSNGAEALSRINGKSKPCLVITDWLMPEMDGINLTKEIKRTVPKIAVIIITAKDLSSLPENPADAVFQKSSFDDFEKKLIQKANALTDNCC